MNYLRMQGMSRVELNQTNSTLKIDAIGKYLIQDKEVLDTVHYLIDTNNKLLDLTIDLEYKISNYLIMQRE